jgi:hypothetical protein
MLEQILNALFYGFLIYMLTGVLFALLRSPGFYELILLVAVPLGTYHYTNDFQASLMAFVCILRTLCCPCGNGLSTRAHEPQRSCPGQLICQRRRTRPLNASGKLGLSLANV